jgi:Apoptosis inhibitory protein 5 (API5)
MWSAQQKSDTFAVIPGCERITKWKKLASSAIAKLNKHFPNLSDTAFVYMLDLCDDGDVNFNIIRKCIDSLFEIYWNGKRGI